MIALLNSTATFLCKWSFLTVSQQTSFILFSLSYLSRGYIYLLIFIEICPLSILFSAEIPFLLLCLGALLLGQNERSISCSCALQREIRKKGFVGYGGAVGRGGFAAELLQDSSAKGGFAAELPRAVQRGCRQMCCRAEQGSSARTHLHPWAAGKGRGLAWVVPRLLWGCLAVPGQQEPVGDREPGWGQEPWCRALTSQVGGAFAVPDLQQGLNGCGNVWGSLSIHKGRKGA